MANIFNRTFDTDIRSTIHERKDSFKAGQSPVQRRFDWPAVLMPGKRARQSALRPNLCGAALNARNRLAASLRRPPSTPRDSVPLDASVPGAQCFRPSPQLTRSRTSRIPSITPGFASTTHRKCPCHRSQCPARHPLAGHGTVRTSVMPTDSPGLCSLRVRSSSEDRLGRGQPTLLVHPWTGIGLGRELSADRATASNSRRPTSI